MRYMTEIEDFVVRVLSKYWFLWPARGEAIKRASRIEMNGKRKYKFITCEKCGKNDLKESDIHVHHKVPKIPLTGFDNILAFAERLLCPASGLMILCKPCHKEVHSGDKRIRVSNKKDQK